MFQQGPPPTQSISLKVKGLYTFPNDLSAIPDGALAVADNVTIDAEGIAQPRRGFDVTTYPLPSSNANKLFQFQNKLIAQYGSSSLAYFDSVTGWHPYTGSFTPIDVNLHRLRSAEANSNLYLTTSTGVQGLDVITGTPFSIGMPQGLDVLSTLVGGASGFMLTATEVAYRVVWGRRDANNNLILGFPSQRSIVANGTGTSSDVSLSITIPAGITTNMLFQIYRSGMSTSATTEPNDELALVYEGNPTAGQITAKSITITDSTPDSLRGASLYTSPSQLGILAGNSIPPLAKDLATYKNCLFYANTQSVQRLSITVVAVGGTSGIAIGDIITIAGVAYTGAASEVVASNQFKVSTGGSPSQNIADTTNSLIRVINQSTSNTLVYAYYMSAYSDLAGKLLLQARNVGSASFTIGTSAHTGAFSPNLTSAKSSASDTYKNGIYVSQSQQPEAVPLTNLFFVGSAAKEILRIIPLRDTLFILKEDGIFRLVGDSPSNFQVYPFDLSTKLLAPDSAVVLSNQIYCLSDQGVVAISDNGVQVISRPIENSLLTLIGQNYNAVKYASFGVSYETDRKYILFVPTSAGDSTPTQAFVYNIFTQSWTRWTRSQKCGLVKTDENLLYVGDSLTSNINLERKTYSFRDYIDEGSSNSISSYSGTVVTLVSVAGINVGDLLYQSSTQNSQIVSINTLTNQVTVQTAQAWSVATATINKGINVIVEWAPNTAQNPGTQKHFREISLMFKNNFFPTANVGFWSESSSSIEYTTLTGSFGGLWGLFPWGLSSWGGAQKANSLRTYIPLEKSRCSQLSIRFNLVASYSTFQLEGYSLIYSGNSFRIGV
jgi:hypothetical protein